MRAERIADWRIRRAELERERADHIANTEPGCRCPWCIGTDEFHAEHVARVKAQQATQSSVPF